MMKLLEKEGIPTHLVEELSDRETAVKSVKIIPLEVIVRNVVAGSMAKRYGLKEGLILSEPVVEFSYKDDSLGDPLINDDHAFAMNLVTREDLELIKSYARKINDFMKTYLIILSIKLIDFKIEFGKLPDGTIVLADEISPDTCRFWDSKTNQKLDKDKFRRDLGDVEGAYHEIFSRLIGDM